MKKQDEDDNKDGGDGEKGSDKGGDEESGLHPVNYELYDVSIIQICHFLRRINLICFHFFTAGGSFEIQRASK